MDTEEPVAGNSSSRLRSRGAWQWSCLTARARVPVAAALLVLVLLTLGTAPLSASADCFVPAEVAPAQAGAASGQIAFVSRRSATYDLYAMDERGRGERPLVRNRPPAGSVDWSAGCRFAFVSWAGNTADVWITDETGSNLRYVAQGSFPSWSPDGTLLAFHTFDPPTVSVVNSDGGGRRMLVRTTIGDIHSPPAWRPDGRELLYDDGEPNLMRLSLATGRTTFVRDIYLQQFAWSPDGSRIVLTDNEGIVTMQPDGRDIRRVLLRPNTGLYSPRPRVDGMLTYVVDASLSVGDSRYAVEAIAPTGGEPRRLFTAQVDWPPQVSWVPSGQAVLSSTYGGNAVVVVGTDGSQRRILSGDASAAPAWSPDRTRLAFATTRGLALLDRRGVLRSLPQAHCDDAISWAPGGKRLVCDSNSNVLLVDLSRPTARVRVLLTDEGIGDPSKDSAAWSPDGRSLVYLADGELTLHHFVRTRRNTSYIPVSGLRTMPSSPSFSPDGRQVLFAGSCGEISPPCRAGIFVVNLNGRGLRRLSRDGANPAWNRAGTKIAFDSVRGGNRDIYVMDVDGSHRLRLTNAARADFDPTWR